MTRAVPARPIPTSSPTRPGVAAALDALGRPDLAERWRALVREVVADSPP